MNRCVKSLTCFVCTVDEIIIGPLKMLNKFCYIVNLLIFSNAPCKVIALFFYFVLALCFSWKLLLLFQLSRSQQLSLLEAIVKRYENFSLSPLRAKTIAVTIVRRAITIHGEQYRKGDVTPMYKTDTKK